MMLIFSVTVTTYELVIQNGQCSEPDRSEKWYGVFDREKWNVDEFRNVSLEKN